MAAAAALVSIQRAALRKEEDDQVDTISKAVYPEKFKDERKWPDWEPAFVNYISTIPGSYHVPFLICRPRTRRSRPRT